MSVSNIETIADFNHPPVAEVCLGVQFAGPVVDLEVLAMFVSRIKAEFPNRQQVEPLGRIDEDFARPPGGLAAFRIVQGPPLPRTWCMDEGQQFLVQIQEDRLMFNWRRIRMEDEYPRYKVLRPRFEAILKDLIDVFAELGRPAPPTDAVEVSYVNELSDPTYDGSADRHPDLAKLLRVASDSAPGGFLPVAEDSGFQARYAIPEQSGARGRLLVHTDSAYRMADQRPIYLLKLDARMVAVSQLPLPVVDLLDLGRMWVVSAFLELTTSEVQDRWGPQT